VAVPEAEGPVFVLHLQSVRSNQVPLAPPEYSRIFPQAMTEIDPLDEQVPRPVAATNFSPRFPYT
jgi:hypothetical protein